MSDLVIRARIQRRDQAEDELRTAAIRFGRASDCARPSDRDDELRAAAIRYAAALVECLGNSADAPTSASHLRELARITRGER